MLDKVRQLMRNVNTILYCNFRLPPKLCFHSFGTKKGSIIRVFIIRKKDLRTIRFKGKFDRTSSLFSESNIINLPDKVSIENCLFVSKSLNNQLPEIFNNWFVFSSDTHRYEMHALKKVFLK